MPMVSSGSYGHTADYLHIDEALKSRWRLFCALDEEIKSFVPRPVAGFAEEREAELARFRGLNPNHSEESLVALVNRQIAFRALPESQLFSAFEKRFMTEYVIVVALAHSLCEALINAILALGLSYVRAEGLF